MTLTWYGHSCFKIEDSAASVVFDPYSPGSIPGLELPSLKADYCVCSHKHSDHFYSRGVELTGRTPVLNMEQLSTFHDGKGGLIRGGNKCTVVQLGSLRFLHMGDIGHALSNSQLETLGRIDVLMVPVGGYYTIDARLAKQMKQALDPAVTIPMHYRGEGFGLPEIAKADDFISLCDDVVYFDTNTIELEKLPRKCTAVLKCPAKE